jgi:hypothetical protein
MKPNISEFSYGYALTSELVRSFGIKGVGAPVFPSLKEEGSLGYDVGIPGLPLFLQFKLCDEMVSAAADQADLLGVPHLRMHLRPLRYSEQHDLLRALEARGNLVFYAAPEFTEPADLNEAYDQGFVLARSALWAPSDIGPLDGENHHVAFRAGDSVGYVCSEPIAIKKPPALDVLTGRFRRQLLQGPAHLPTREYFARVARDLREVYQEERPLAMQEDRRERASPPRDPQDEAALMAHSLFGCSLLFVPSTSF